MKEASDQEKNSCGQGGRERQGQTERQAERQRRDQVKLGQFQDMLADTSPDSCSAAWFVAARVVAVVQEPSHLGLLCCYLLSRPSLDLQLRRQLNLLPPPMPFVPVLSVRADCPAASVFPDDSIFSLGLTAAFEALRPSWDSVSSDDDASKHSGTSKKGKRGDRARAHRFGQVNADLWTSLSFVSVSFPWI